jgi:hypothetical protein
MRNALELVNAKFLGDGSADLVGDTFEAIISEDDQPELTNDRTLDLMMGTTSLAQLLVTLRARDLGKSPQEILTELGHLLAPPSE